MLRGHLESSGGDLTIVSLLLAAGYELKLRDQGEVDDNINLGREVRESAKSLLMFLNEHSSGRPEPRQM